MRKGKLQGSRESPKFDAWFTMAFDNGRIALPLDESCFRSLMSLAMNDGRCDLIELLTTTDRDSTLTHHHVIVLGLKMPTLEPVIHAILGRVHQDHSSVKAMLTPRIAPYALPYLTTVDR
jgi:hypothetical protein